MGEVVANATGEVTMIEFTTGDNEEVSPTVVVAA